MTHEISVLLLNIPVIILTRFILYLLTVFSIITVVPPECYRVISCCGLKRQYKSLQVPKCIVGKQSFSIHEIMNTSWIFSTYCKNICDLIYCAVLVTFPFWPPLTLVTMPPGKGSAPHPFSPDCCWGHFDSIFSMAVFLWKIVSDPLL